MVLRDLSDLLVLFTIPSVLFAQMNVEPCTFNLSSEFSEWENLKRLERHTFLTYGPSGKDLCRKKCNHYQECHSVNINMETLQCELNDVNSTAYPNDLVTRTNFMSSNRNDPVHYKGTDTCIPPYRIAQLENGVYTCKTDCPAGTRFVDNACVCPVGKHHKDPDKFGAYNCLDCQVGHYQDQEGQGQCKQCPAGQYQDEEGKTSCKLCAVGHFTDAAAQNVCVPCPVGQFQNSAGASSCVRCLAGTYQNNQGQTSCISCSPGYYQANTGQTSCSSCNPGTYQPYGGRTTCTPCPSGHYQSSYGQTSCYSCIPGQYQYYPGQQSCNYCSPGYYGPYYGLPSCYYCSSSTSYGQTSCG